MTVALKYDDLFLNDPSVGNGQHRLAKARAQEIVQEAQSLYNHPSLARTVQITIKITSLKHLDLKDRKYRFKNVRLDDFGSCDFNCKA